MPHEVSTEVMSSIVAFLIEELRATRARALTPFDEFQLELVLRRSARHTRRLERMANTLSKLDEATPKAS